MTTEEVLFGIALGSALTLGLFMSSKEAFNYLLKAWVRARTKRHFNGRANALEEEFEKSVQESLKRIEGVI